MSQINAAVKCPKCGEFNVLCHADLDERLENDEVIPMVCFHCEHKWDDLSAEDRDRLRKQRKEWRSVRA